MSGEQYTMVPLADIQPGDNDRTVFKPEDLEGLANDIAAIGLNSPITIRPVEGRERPYEIVTGERRFRAFQILEKRDPDRWTCIKAFIRSLTDEEAADLMLSENIQRKDLDPIDEATGYQKRMKALGLTVGQVAARYHVSEQRVRDRLALLNLVEDAQHLVRHGHMPLGHAQVMGRQLDRNFQRFAIKAMQDTKGITLDRFTQVVSQLAEKQNQASLWDLSLFEQKSGAEIVAEVTAKEVVSTTIDVSNECATMYLVVFHEKGAKVMVDKDAIRRAVQVTHG